MKPTTKDSAMRIRVEADVHAAFMETCKLKGIPAAQILRQFMRSYVKENKLAGMQGNMFEKS